MTHTAEGAAGYIPPDRHVLTDLLRSYRTELSSDLLDEQGEVLDHLIGFAFDRLGVRVLEVRVVLAEDRQPATGEQEIH